jgi:MoxR-like ATPase
MTGDAVLSPAGTSVAADRTPDWWIYRGTGEIIDVEERERRWPAAPPWRDFRGGPDLPTPEDDEQETLRRLGPPRPGRQPDLVEVDAVNAAIYLRRPLLVSGAPGVGKSSLAYRLARELRLGRVLHWPITSRTTLRSGLYDYDAIGRAQFAGDPGNGAARPAAIGTFVHLGPLGTALLPRPLPRVLLIDEMDKGDIDLANDLLNVFEDGRYTIPELRRIRRWQPSVEVNTDDPSGAVAIHDGEVRCHAFPIVVITSNGEREFPAPFLRRCLRLDIPNPDAARLAELVSTRLRGVADDEVRRLIADFVARREGAGLIAADQLLNAVHLAASGAAGSQEAESWQRVLDIVWRSLSTADW